MQDYHLEHSQDLGKAEQAFSQCYKHALGNLEAETGGYFYFDKSLNFSFHSCTNLNSYEKNQFNFRDSQFYNYYINDQIVCLFHTHITDDVAPSELDKETSHSFRLPCYIFSTKSKESYLFYPDNHKPTALDKRQFIPLFQDCISYIKDYLIFNFNINLNEYKINWARPRNDPNKVLINYLDLYFNEVDKNDIKNGDILVFPETISKYFHVGIVDKESYLFHHPVHMFPEKQLISDSMLNQVYKVYRHKDL
jgi:hypothetical protein